jgi:FkbM family methyltransferase
MVAGEISRRTRVRSYGGCGVGDWLTRYPITLPDDKGIWTGTYELELAKAIAERGAGEATYASIAVDGADFFSGVMALAGASRVYAFEPLPAKHGAVAKDDRAESRFCPSRSSKPRSRSSRATLEFVVMPESSMGKLTTSSFQQENQGGQKIQVRRQWPLDTLWVAGEVQPPAVMKIDVEGAEMLVPARCAGFARHPSGQRSSWRFIRGTLARIAGALLEETGTETFGPWEGRCATSATFTRKTEGAGQIILMMSLQGSVQGGLLRPFRKAGMAVVRHWPWSVCASQSMKTGGKPVQFS